ncbi:hypothetical protein UFO1_0099 [Pelosinus sp. UFO1]|nr:hypothetical protein UFO1_0099 [Pelosinus sp. UFO1]
MCQRHRYNLCLNYKVIEMLIKEYERIYQSLDGNMAQSMKVLL